ncbi:MULTISPECIES: hypothetical protein [unclassified Streptomyces]|uniref:hypothetical protein n=1 Tax=unclassified Streptomyces TaxID=2593676 RepID=UPI0033FD2D7B
MFTSVGSTALVLLTACGDGGGGDADKGGRDGVASIDSPAAGGGSPRSKSADPDAGRPQLRLDSTREEEMRLYDAWAACMKENGAEKKENNAINEAALKACRSKQPLDPPELDPAKNPEYRDDTRTMVRCMNKHGIKSVLTEDGWGLDDGDSLNHPDYQEISDACEMKAFGEG